MARVFGVLLLSVLAVFVQHHGVHSCTNFIITPGASADGATLISYNADDHTLYGTLAHWPAGTHAEGSIREIYEWDTGDYLGYIPEAHHTYNVVGNMNEYALTITETTFGGLDMLATQNGSILDYGSLIYITLQRAKTAREAIHLMGQLVHDYGYYSDGESFSIGDPSEAWVMDLIGKGEGELGAVWVAMRLPNGTVSGHANQARIRTFPLNDPENCIYAPDVIDFARAKGLFPMDAPAETFSFSDTFNPLNFEGARSCEARVWSFFSKVADGMEQYFDYVSGKNLTNRMPLWVTPNRKISVNDTFGFLRDHFEGTWFDFRSDAGAQAFNMPYRWRPLDWTDPSNGNLYVNERAASTQQTGFSMVGQMRGWMPAPIGGLLWLGTDDAACTVYVPFYSGITSIPQSYAKGNGAMMVFSFTSAFWVFNMVSNWAYSRFNVIHPEIAAASAQFAARFFNETALVDAKASAAYATDKKAALAILTDYSVSTGNQVVEKWLEFWKYLFLKFMDGNVKVPNPDHTQHNPLVAWPGYGDAWLERIVAETGDHYLESVAPSPLAGRPRAAVPPAQRSRRSNTKKMYL